jgi:hypothetical protein
MHYSSNLSKIAKQTPPLYAKRSTGFMRTTTTEGARANIPSA